MKIELDDLIASLNPEPIVLVIDGREYPVNELSLAEVVLLQEAGKKTNLELVEQMERVFKSGSPPTLAAFRDSHARGDADGVATRTRIVRELTLIYAALLAAIVEVGSPKKLEAATALLTQRVAAASADSTASAD